MIETWFQRCQKDIDAWDSEQPLLLLLDMSRVILTPFGRSKAGELANVRPELGGRTAVVIAASTMGHLTRLFVNHSLHGTRQRRVFFSRDDAQTWLEESL